MIVKISLIISLFLLSTYTFADFNAKVVKIVDGDTIHAKDYMSNKIYKVRLLGIDAPEKDQSYGKRSTNFLKGIIDKKYISIISKPKNNNPFSLDRYKRVIGKIVYENKDINYLMLQNGMAWHYKKYKNSQSKVDQESYSIVESIASKNSVGLWSASKPIPPWKWRKAYRKR